MIQDSLTPTPLISSATGKKTHVINFTDDTNAKDYKDRNQHSSHRLLNNNKTKQSFSYPKFCWKCKARLVYRKLWDGDYGLYCKSCSRFRKFRVETRGGGQWCRTDVRRSGKYKRKVLLGEVVESESNKKV